MGRKKKKKEKFKGVGRVGDFFKRFFKSIIAIVLLSALILAISLFIKGMSNANTTGFYGVLSKLFTKYDIGKKKIENITGENIIDINNSQIYSNKEPKGNVVFKVCLVSDIHQDSGNLAKALEKVKNSGCISMVVIGDITNYGDTPSLREIRNILDNAGIDYYAIPGDHDLAESVSVQNFNSVFGINYHLMEYSDVSFLIVDNSPNYTNMSSTQIMWVENNVGNVDFVILSQPLFTEGLNPPFNSIYMGSAATPPEDIGLKKMQLGVRESGNELLELIRKNKDIKAVFAGEHHRSSEISDTKREGLIHYVVGAVTSTVNDLPQNVIQTPRFSVLSVYDSGDYYVEDILID